MKAVLFRQHGSLDVLEYVENFPVPELAPDEVLVKVRYAALNRLDQFVVRGWKGLNLPLPHIPGADFSGSVVALGEDVSGWVAGQPVTANPTLWCGHCHFCLAGQQSLCDTWAILGEHVRGSFAEFVVIPARNLVAVPDGFSMKQAAAAPTVAVTTWRMLVTRGQIKPGETVLIVGAGGGVNSFSIPLAKMLGATVWVVAGGAAKAQQAAELGADWVIDREAEPNWSKAAFLHSNKQGVDVVVDNVGAATWEASLRTLRKGGRLLTVGGTTGYTGQTPINIIFGRQVSIIGSTMGSQIEFEDVMRLIFAGKLAISIDRVYPLAEARQAEERMQEGQHFGKILLEIG
ncbi:MAG: zinc-binding dehydrogenase [Caldilineae bacterium]|nr:zinc-binding dehydrogenase [Anaerolineae bacterium]MCB0253083.1 zinc-binding dehydrogenase [Anaerolineae bacterium]MCB9154734.1 zinc-binding dehydrogenase [Caldilineae bacterium]